MAERKKRVAWRHAGKDRVQEAFFLTLWQPRKATLCNSMAEYLAARVVPTRSYDEILAMTSAERLAMKQRLEQYWGSSWQELVATAAKGGKA